MKGHFFTPFLLGLITCGSLSAQVKHVIVFTDGTTRMGLIDSLTTDSVYYYDTDREQKEVLSLKKVYFIYNDFNKLFFFSPSLHDRLDYLEERGGMVITTWGDSLPYHQIKFDRHWRDPKIYLDPETDSIRTLNFLDAYSIQADRSVLELSVRRGFCASVGLFLLGTSLEIIGDFRDRHTGKLLSMTAVRILSSEIWDEGKDLLPKFSPAGLKQTGVTYHSLTFFTPLTTFGWMAYDLYFDKRTQYIRPLDRQHPFPRDMYVFSARRWVHEKLRGLWRRPRRAKEKETAEEAGETAGD
jgi:hypothetical protein